MQGISTYVKRMVQYPIQPGSPMVCQVSAILQSGQHIVAMQMSASSQGLQRPSKKTRPVPLRPRLSLSSCLLSMLSPKNSSLNPFSVTWFFLRLSKSCLRFPLTPISFFFFFLPFGERGERGEPTSLPLGDRGEEPPPLGEASLPLGETPLPRGEAPLGDPSLTALRGDGSPFPFFFVLCFDASYEAYGDRSLSPASTYSSIVFSSSSCSAARMDSHKPMPFFSCHRPTITGKTKSGSSARRIL
mmetsp:Transcript_9443/g.33415  ORF Transcript_9443/g.33415 Transcript_9443/m.33415 type:complete len:244 (-) Transcript_9443:1250-1981(-)